MMIEIDEQEQAILADILSKLNVNAASPGAAVYVSVISSLMEKLKVEPADSPAE